MIDLGRVVEMVKIVQGRVHTESAGRMQAPGRAFAFCMAQRDYRVVHIQRSG